MVITVGCFYQVGYLERYNSETGESKKVKIQYTNDVEVPFQLFDGLEKIIKDPIEYFCILLPDSWKNNTLKKFIQFVKSKTYIINVRIIKFYSAVLCNAVEMLSVSPVHGDSIWTFIDYQECFDCMMWSFSEENEWKFIKECSQKKVLKGSNLTIDELKALKSQTVDAITGHPYILVHSDGTIDEEGFRSVSSNYKNITFVTDIGVTNAALNYARYLSNETKFSKYKIKPFLKNPCKIKQNDSTIFSSYAFATLPIKETINLSVEKDDVLMIFEKQICSATVKAESKTTFDLTFESDLNGIYTLYAKNIILYENYKSEEELYFIPKQKTFYDPDSNAVGIDFGTTECCAAVIRKEGADCFELDSVTALRTMPSYIAFDEEKPKCGQIVVERMRNKSEYSVFDLKRIMGKSFEKITVNSLWPFKIVKDSNNFLIETETLNEMERKSPEEISAVLLNHIKTLTESYQSVKLTDAVITIPAKFTDQQKSSLETAAKLAGWTNITFLPEPVAATFAYFTKTKIPNNSNILICDCGGGTVDICVAKICDEQLRILCFDGDSYLGGRDFDNVLFTHFNGILKHEFKVDVMESRKKYSLTKKCKEIKHTLSVAEEAWLNVDDFLCDSVETIEIKKSEFESMSLTLLIRIKDVILRALSTANIQKYDINYVFQVGGGCRMPMIKKLLADIFPDSNHRCTVYPDWIVAEGAALFAYHLKLAQNGIPIIDPSQAASWLTEYFEV